jgi:hypothetical protein
MAASKGRPELIPEGADEAVMRSDNYPTPKPAAKKAKPAAQDTSGKAPAKLGSQGSFKFDTSKSIKLTPPDEKKPTTTFPPKGVTGYAPVTRFSSTKKEEEDRPKFTRNPVTNKKVLENMRKGGAVKKYASGGSVGSASKRADGIAQRGKTKGRIC